jgi:hypothetical protein
MSTDQDTNTIPTQSKEVCLSVCETKFIFIVSFSEEVLYRAVHGTLIFFLQNDAGFEAWGPTDKRVAALTKAFKRQ